MLMLMKHSNFFVIKLQLFSLLRGKYHGLLNSSVPCKLLRHCHKVVTKDGGTELTYGGENTSEEDLGVL